MFDDLVKCPCSTSLAKVRLFQPYQGRSMNEMLKWKKMQLLHSSYSKEDRSRRWRTTPLFSLWNETVECREREDLQSSISCQVMRKGRSVCLPKIESSRLTISFLLKTLFVSWREMLIWVLIGLPILISLVFFDDSLNNLFVRCV